MLLTGLLILIVNSGCAHVDVYNQRIYGDLGQAGAHWAETLTDKTGDIPKYEWDQMRVGMFCMDVQAFTDVETSLSQACQLVTCDYKTRETLRQIFEKIHKLAKETNELRLL